MVMRYRLAKAGIIGFEAIERQNLGEVIHIWKQFLEDEKKELEWQVALADRTAIQVANNLAPLMKAIAQSRN